MTIMDAINKEIDGVIEYMLMLSGMSGQPADFMTVKNGRRYALMLREIPDEEQAPPQDTEEVAEE